ncbi:phage portal protein [Methylobacterium nodulans]|uniref:Phage portal protein, HK97 family n=1 Tax=Methylobacterium nodulans (strain LMG 21967 / CNCM I-2342 / ORS 2060) TaxID=460265 RepID=B8IA97_METNO|nr:phage portal protein [Methylobacterium nodulans]ACL57574.1 phage portal protein, HK97 family [Methylobacterium nodulans ORS 2060]ACL59160.1 phage portal protein, HK97 family [Methylobacterium nodulans ORS 2060]
MARSTFLAALGNALAPRTKALAPVPQGRGGWLRILESVAGAWQQSVAVKYNAVLSHHADFACRTLIASDIAKLRIKLVQRGDDGIWAEVTNPAYSPVLRKPNHFQNRIQFMESWVLSKLQSGNSIVLKQRDNRGVVVRLYVLDWNLVTPLVADDGSVFYQLNTDRISGLTGSVVVPAREIIHDRFNCFFHPLIGLSPIFAGGLAATQGLAIQNDSTQFFQNGAQPSGILTAPGAIHDDTAKRLKEHWESNYSGKNAGKVAVLGDGLKYEPMKAKAVDFQLIEQLRWTAEVVCSTYHVPPYKIGVGPLPSYNNVQALNIEYYSQCLQALIEAIELCLDEGLGLAEGIGTEFDVDNLLRMDTTALINAEKEAVGAGIKSPNEARRRLDLKPVPGGESPYLQQQNFSLAALAKRDAQADPFHPAAVDAPPDPQAASENIARLATALRLKFAEAPAHG